MHDKLLAQARIEQCQNWQRGSPRPVEEYLDRFPVLRDDEDATLDLIYCEVLLREARGDVVGTDEYTARFPHVADRLRRQLEFDRIIRSGFRSGSNGYISTFAPSNVPTADAIDLPSVPGYEILAEVGRGARGIVYKARQQSVNRIVALKILIDSEGMSRREAETAASLNHPNIIGVYDFREHAGRFHLAMEYADGGSLQHRLKHAPLRPGEAAQIIETLARALAAVHDRGIIHRDLKPANVLLTADGTPKLADFGLAKRLGGDASLAPAGTVIGTLGYMAPEQAAGDTKDVGPAADIYSLGTILYEALTGRPPFQGTTFLEILYHFRVHDPAPIRNRQRHVPPDLEAVCLKCLERSPKNRYASALALAEDLWRWQQGQSTIARPRSALTKLWCSVKRHPWLLALTSVLVLVILLATIVRAYTDPDRPLRDIERQIARGNPVVLVAQTGGPRWSRWRVHADPGFAPPAPGEHFSVQSWGFSLLELVPDPQWTSYRLRAEVMHLESDENGEVGVYVGHKEYAGSEGKIHHFTQLSFNDIRVLGKPRLPAAAIPNESAPLKNLVCLIPTFYAEGNANGLWGRSLSGKRRRLFHPAGRGLTQWRRLTIEVTPDQICGIWDIDHSVGELALPTLREATESVLAEIRQSRPQDEFLRQIDSPFAARGGLGLYVLRGSAAFRNVVIEPLEE